MIARAVAPEPLALANLRFVAFAAVAGAAFVATRLGLPPRPRADDWTLRLTLERVADSVGWGEAAALGIPAA